MGKKGGGSGGGLTEQSDTLKATSYAQVLDLISEGEIGGLVDGLKSIYLDNVPIQNPDGTNNFSNVVYTATTGTQSQGVISGADQAQSEIAVGIEVKVSTGPVVRTITNSNVTSVIVTVQIPSLTYLDSKGNLGGSSVNFAIDLQQAGGGWVEKINDTIYGKSSSSYERQYRITLPTGSGPFDVRLRRITADSTTTSTNNKTYFLSYTEVVDAKLSYPNSALIALKVDASQFRAIPTRGYDVKLLKIRIPTNATVRSDGSLSYTGTWDGTFKIAWSCCPAWAYYDLLTTDRYGLGNYVDAAQVDKWALYTISKYCNELVDNGFGSTEPRFTCNVWINTRQDAYKLLSDLTSCFRGMAYWGSGAVTAVQDAPKDASYLYTNANVIDGVFRYEGTSAKARHTVALVTWNDPADMFRQKVEYVEDTTGIARYGVIETEIVAFGCASRGQAHRAGRWLLYSERYETEICTFQTGAEGAICRPGDVIKVADQYRAGARQGGRITASTSTTVTVDNLSTTIAAGSTLHVMGVDGAVQNRTVSSVSGNVITVSAAFSPSLGSNAIWAATTSTIVPQTFRVLSLTETQDGGHEIAALAHNPNKYSQIENNLKLQARTYTELDPIPVTPTGLTLTENTYSYQNTTRSKISLTWNQTDNATSWKVEWRVDNGNFASDTCTTTDYEILDTLVGAYTIRVTALSATSRPSSGYVQGTITTVGNNIAPTAVSDLTAAAVVGGISLMWSTAASALWQAEVYENTTNNSATATLVATVSATAYIRTGLTATDGVRYYWVKLVNTQGVKSAFSNGASNTAVSVSNGSSTALVYIYQRGASAPALPSATVTYTFATGVATGLNNGWSQAIPSGTDPLYVSIATATSVSTTDTIDSTEWATPVVLAQNGTSGANGLNSATVYLFQRTATSTAPSLPSATVTYTFATGAASGVNNGWSQTMPTTGGSYRWVTTASALGAGTTDTIASTEWAAAALIAQDGVDGATGARVVVLDMYKWSSTAPTTYPSGTSTYTWSTGTFTAPGTTNGWTLTPGTPSAGQTLYVISQYYTDTSTSATSTVTWSSTSPYPAGAAGTNGSNGIDGTDGTNGANGWRTAVLEMYRWSSTTPTTFPSGTSTYTWSTGAFTTPGTTNGWSLVPGTPSGTNQVLYGITTVYSDTNTTATSSVTWPASPTPYPLTPTLGDLAGLNSVATAKIDANAVTNLTAAFTSGYTTKTSGSWQSVQTITFTATGQPVLINAGIVALGAMDTLYLMRIKRGSTVVWSSTAYYTALTAYSYGTASVAVIDTPASGSVTYDLEINPSTASVYAYERFLSALETKR